MSTSITWEEGVRAALRTAPTLIIRRSFKVRDVPVEEIDEKGQIGYRLAGGTVSYSTPEEAAGTAAKREEDEEDELTESGA